MQMTDGHCSVHRKTWLASVMMLRYKTKNESNTSLCKATKKEFSWGNKCWWQYVRYSSRKSNILNHKCLKWLLSNYTSVTIWITFNKGLICVVESENEAWNIMSGTIHNDLTHRNDAVQHCFKYLQICEGFLHPPPPIYIQDVGFTITTLMPVMADWSTEM